MDTLAKQVPDYIRNLKALEGTDLSSLDEAPLVVISAAKFGNPDPRHPDPVKRYDALRFEASLGATRSYALSNVPQVVMCDSDSHPHVPAIFAEYGAAVVVNAPRPGLATPYLDAAWLVRQHNPHANTLKAEPDKLLDDGTLALINRSLSDSTSIVVGDRTTASMETMTAVQHRTEVLIDTYTKLMLAIPYGVSSGVQAYSPRGLDVFLEYERLLETFGNNWKYLLWVPETAYQRYGMNVRAVPVNIRYDDWMVSAERDMPAITLKRLEQLLVMLEGAIQIAQQYGPNRSHAAPSQERLTEAEAALRVLRALAAQA